MANTKKRLHFNTKAKKKDQFYTDPTIATRLVDLTVRALPEERRRLLLEPAAGAGAFLVPMKNQGRAIGLDIEPKHGWVKEGNFLEIKASDLDIVNTSEVCVIGNPPFGFAANLAVQFFNHAATMADTIAFIVPRTFRKASVHNKLDKNFWLFYDDDVDKDAFIFRGETYDVPCCFQIWERKDRQRPKIELEKSPLFTFTTPDQADFAVRRVGGRAGKTTDVVGTKVPSHYYIKANPSVGVIELRAMIDGLNFDREKSSTAGVNSVSKQELVNKSNRERMTAIYL